MSNKKLSVHGLQELVRLKEESKTTQLKLDTTEHQLRITERALERANLEILKLKTELQSRVSLAITEKDNTVKQDNTELLKAAVIESEKQKAIVAQEEAKKAAEKAEAQRVAAEQEAQRVAAEADAKKLAAQRAQIIADEQEAQRVAAEQEAQNAAVNIEREAQITADSQEAQRVAAEQKAQKAEDTRRNIELMQAKKNAIIAQQRMAAQQRIAAQQRMAAQRRSPPQQRKMF